MSALPTAPVAPLQMILTRIGAELLGCRAILADIEEAAIALSSAQGRSPSDARAVGSGLVQEMQKIDLLGQVLTDLEVCIRALAANEAVGASAPLALRSLTRQLRLDGVRRRIEGQHCGSNGHAATELF